MKYLLYCLLPFLFGPQEKIHIYLVGDSTMSIKSTKAVPEMGWGVPFATFFDSTAVVENHAQNGRSTRSFMQEKRWEPIVNKLEKGDYVLIQFGHNDEIPTKKSATTPDEFRKNLEKYVNDTREKNAFPVLITAVARRSFSPEGKLTDTHREYSDITRSVAKQLNVPLVDLDEKSRALLQQMGPESSKLLYLHLKPGEHPNYPDGKTDDTHFNELGARLMAQLVLKELRSLKIPVTDHVVNNGKK